MTCPKCSGLIESVPLPGGLRVETCSNCSGVFYDAEELAIPLTFENAMRSRYVCPKCGQPMETGTLFGGRLTTERCTACLGFWLDAGEVPKLRVLAGTDQVLGAPGSALLPAPGVSGAGVPPPQSIGGGPIPPPPPAATPRPEAPSPTVYSEPQPEDCANWPNPDLAANPTLIHDKKIYAHFQTSLPVVTFVLGEFNWKVAVGEKAMARDFVAPPHILCEDRSGSDSVWSQGVYLEPREVWDAFELPGNPPMRRGVAPAQPNPYAAEWAESSTWFGIFVAAFVLVYLGALVLTGGKAHTANLFWFMLLLAAPPLLSWFNSRTFEVERWQESDHPWAAGSDDDDGDDD